MSKEFPYAGARDPHVAKFFDYKNDIFDREDWGRERHFAITVLTTQSKGLAPTRHFMTLFLPQAPRFYQPPGGM